MTSGAMLTALAIFAAVWIQAGYLWKLRLKLARGRPLGTSTVVVVALTLVVEAARWTERKGLTGDWTGTAELGATVGVAVCIVWTVLAISTKVQFRTANAKRFEEATYDTIKEGKESDLRTLAKEMAGTPVRRMVASAKDVGYGERHGKQQHETRWSALRTLNQMSDPGMMKAICKEKGDVVADLVDETSKSKGEDRREWYSGEERGMGYLLETEERIVGAMATEAVQKDCPLLDEAETLWGPRGNKYHPTQMRWDDTILDKVWGNPDLVRRSERRFWNFWRWGVGEHVDQAKVRRIVLAVTDTILALPPNPEWRWTEPHYGLEQVLLKAVREGENKEGEKTGETGWFLKELARMINKREERERTKQTDNTWNQASILVQPEGYTKSIAEIMLMFMRWSTGAEGMAAWNRWLGVRCADAMWFREIEDRDWIPTVQRQLDKKIWQQVSGIARKNPWEGNVRLLGYYLRMEGIRETPTELGVKPGNEQAKRTYRRRRALHRATRRVCELHLVQAVRANGNLRPELERDGMELKTLANGTTELHYTQRSALGTEHKYTMRLR